MSKYPEHHILFQNPRSISHMLAGTSWTSLSDGSLDTFAKLLVLDFFLASIYLQAVDYYEALIYPHVRKKDVLNVTLTKNPHLQVPLGLFEPRTTGKSDEAFKEIEDAEGIVRSVNNLVDSIDFVVRALQSNDITSAQRQMYDRLMENLRSMCQERRNNAQRALDALNRHLDYLTKRHAIREAKSIKTLTLLASLYLPLSLSASILGMSTPFKQIANNKSEHPQSYAGTNLLFDFFGVFIGLATVTVFIVYAIRLGMWLKYNGWNTLSRSSSPFSIFYYGRRWRFGGLGGSIFEITQSITRWWIGSGFCITLLVIFFIGMLRTAQKAWDAAKWMFIAYVAGSAILLMGCAGLYYFLYYKRVRRR